MELDGAQRRTHQPTALGQRVRSARTARGISQARLAQYLGIKQEAVSQIELGETQDPGASRVRGIAEFLGVSADYLLSLSDEEHGHARVG